MPQESIQAGAFEMRPALRVAGIGEHDAKVVTQSNPDGLSVNYEDIDAGLIDARTGGLYTHVVNGEIMYVGKFSTSLKSRSLYAAKKTIYHQNKCKMLKVLQEDPNAEIRIYVIPKQDVMASLGITASPVLDKYFNLEVAEADLIGDLNPPWNTQNRPSRRVEQVTEGEFSDAVRAVGQSVGDQEEPKAISPQEKPRERGALMVAEATTSTP